MLRPMILVALAVGFAGCIASSQKLNAVSLGMTKAEVLSVMGEPASTRAHGRTEILIYNLAPPEALFVNENNLPEYFVRLVDGKVEAFGRVGDFGSTRDPTLNVKLR